MDGWVDGRAGLSIAYSKQQTSSKRKILSNLESFYILLQCLVKISNALFELVRKLKHFFRFFSFLIKDEFLIAVSNP